MLMSLAVFPRLWCLTLKWLPEWLSKLWSTVWVRGVSACVCVCVCMPDCCLHKNLKPKLNDFYAYQEWKLKTGTKRKVDPKHFWKLPTNVAHWNAKRKVPWSKVCNWNILLPENVVNKVKVGKHSDLVFSFPIAFALPPAKNSIQLEDKQKLSKNQFDDIKLMLRKGQRSSVSPSPPPSRTCWKPMSNFWHFSISCSPLCGFY